jgi:hypothetical protein
MRSTILIAALAAALILGLVAGCGGGGSVSPDAFLPGQGAITGTVIYFDAPSAPTVNDVFRINASPGTHTVTVVPPDTFALPQASVDVNVSEGVLTSISDPFLLFPEGEQPPGNP